MSKDPTELRIQREMKTVEVMIHLFCRGLHKTSEDLCASCESLWLYAQQRVECCPIRVSKPICKDCTIHCYNKERREQIREVMRYAGPRMPWRQPVLTWFHIVNRRKSGKYQTTKR